MGYELDKIVNTKGVPTDHEHYCPICGRLVPKFEFDLKNSQGLLIHHVVQPICKCEAEADQREWDRLRGRERRDKFEEKYSALNDKTNRYTECTLENFEVTNDNKDAYEAAKKFLESYPFCRGLYIYGVPGNGKSHLAAAIANAVKQSNERIVIYTSYVDALEKLRAAISRGKDAEDKVMGALACCDLLVLDDLGVEKASEYSCEVLFRILDRRARNGLPIVFTSNYAPEDLNERYERATDIKTALRITGRVIDNSFIVRNWGESRRQPLLKIDTLQDGLNQF